MIMDFPIKIWLFFLVNITYIFFGKIIRYSLTAPDISSFLLPLDLRSLLFFHVKFYGETLSREHWHQLLASPSLRG